MSDIKSVRKDSIGTPKQITDYNFEDHQDIPFHLGEWVLKVADVDNIYSLDLADINNLINGYNQWCDEKDVA